jgi:hypothetical protein
LAKNPKFLNPYEEGGLKVKKKSLLVVIAILSVLLVGAGSAYAVLGVADDVPANAVVVPIICGVGANGLNTTFAVAETTCPPVLDPLVTTPDGNAVIMTHASVRNSCSQEVYTFNKPFTCYDVESFNCKDLIEAMSPGAQNQMKISVEGTDYYAGYMILNNITSPDNDLIGWTYLVDLNLGFASGFNMIGLEDGAGARLEEDGGAIAISAFDFMPRYFVLNDKAETHNWWIVLAGRNQLGNFTCRNASGSDVVISNCSSAILSRSLKGIICNEQEDCPDFEFGIPRELNIIDVEKNLPGSLHPAGFPKGGFAKLGIVERGDFLGTSVQVNGSVDGLTVCGLTAGNFYSIFGYAYQREQADTSTLSWDVVHPMHRDYCLGASPAITAGGLCAPIVP